MARKSTKAKKPAVILTAAQATELCRLHDEMPRGDVDPRTLTPAQLMAVAIRIYLTPGAPATSDFSEETRCKFEIARRTLTGELIENK